MRLNGHHKIGLGSGRGDQIKRASFGRARGLTDGPAILNRPRFQVAVFRARDGLAGRKVRFF